MEQYWAQIKKKFRSLSSQSNRQIEIDQKNNDNQDQLESKTEHEQIVVIKSIEPIRNKECDNNAMDDFCEIKCNETNQEQKYCIQQNSNAPNCSIIVNYQNQQQEEQISQQLEKSQIFNDNQQTDQICQEDNILQFCNEFQKDQFHSTAKRSNKMILQKQQMKKMDQKIDIVKMEAKRGVAQRISKRFQNYKKHISIEFMEKIIEEVQQKKTRRNWKYFKKILLDQIFTKTDETVNQKKLKSYKRVFSRILSHSKLKLVRKCRQIINQNKRYCMLSLDKSTYECENKFNESTEIYSIQSKSEVSDDEFCKIDFNEQRKKILLVGKAGVGKTKLFNQFNFSSTTNQVFKEGNESEGQIDLTFVDTPSFEFDNTIDQRDANILLFQDYFLNNQVSTFAIVVNFERTDLMKAKVKEVNKYIKEISQKQTIIVVTDWEKSESENDRAHLEERFEYFGYKILYIPKDCENLKQQFYDAVKQFPNKNLNLQGSIFEIPNDIEEQNAQLMQMLNQLFNNNPQRIEAIKNQSSTLFGLNVIFQKLLELYYILIEKIQRKKQPMENV